MKFVFAIIIIIISVILQKTLMPLIAIWNIEFQLTTLTLVFLASKLEVIPLLLIAALGGLINDSYNPTLIGASIAAFTTTAFLLGNIIKSVDFSEKISYLFIPFLAVLVEELTYYLFTPQRDMIFHFSIRYILPEALFTSLICLVIAIMWENKSAIS